MALRDWGSDEETLLSEVDLAPVSPILPAVSNCRTQEKRQKLPLPEDRVRALSIRFPPQVIPIDVSGSGFRRMELFRRSLIQVSSS